MATTTRLETEGSLLLGSNEADERLPALWDVRRTLLASSAFPAVFPVVWAGPEHHLSDGGVFDNLPILPAIDQLAGVQVLDAQRIGGSPRARLEARLAQPDLFIAVALTEPPIERDEESGLRPVAIAGRRSHQAKLRSVVSGMRRVRALLEALVEQEEQPRGRPSWDEYVNFDLVQVQPRVLNGTFAFEPATGLDDETMDRSIVDGCRQTLRALAAEGRSAAGSAALPILEQSGRLLQPLPGGSGGADGCHWFRHRTGGFVCPFARIEGRTKRALRATCGRGS